jgi:hypothetical protein
MLSFVRSLYWWCARSSVFFISSILSGCFVVSSHSLAVAQIAELKFGKDRKRKFREYFVMLETEAVKYYDNPPDIEKPPRGVIPLSKGTLPLSRALV